MSYVLESTEIDHSHVSEGILTNPRIPKVWTPSLKEYYNMSLPPGWYEYKTEQGKVRRRKNIDTQILIVDIQLLPQYPKIFLQP